MFEILKQSIFASLGVALMTKDKVAELASDLAARAKLTAQQASEFEKELEDRAEQAQADLQAEIDQRIDHAFIQLGILKGGVKKDFEEAQAKGKFAFEDSLETLIDRLGLARAEDMKALSIRLEALEKHIEKKE